MEHMNIARRGESEAEGYLTGIGYSIIERNWYHRHKEIDLIAIDREDLVIVEVKSRQAPVLDDPNLAVDKKKQRNLVYAAHAYARWNRITLDIRFDVVWVVFNGTQVKVDHIRNAFIPGLY